MVAPPSHGPSSAFQRMMAHRQHLSPLDWLTAIYACCSALILAARVATHSPWMASREPGWLLLAHALLLLLVGLAAVARRQAAPRPSPLAEWYPLVVLLAVYASIGLTNGPRQELGLSHDPLLRHWEGRIPTWASLDRWGGNEAPAVMHWWLGLAYLGFFPMVIAGPLVLWLRREYEHARRAIFAITLTFLICYLLFLLFPVAGPAYSMGWPAGQSDADLPVRLVRGLNDRGDSWGSAFPSSHVAASFTALLLGMIACRKLGSALLPIALGIVLAVVHFRIHYVLDAAAGLLVASTAAWLVVRRWPIVRPATGAGLGA